MHDQIEIIRSYLRMAWIYRWLALIIAAVFCFGGWIFVLSLPDQFGVSAKIFIDTRSMLRPLLRGIALDSNVLSDTAALMQRTLLTRPNLEEVARRADLDLTTKDQRAFDALVDSLAKRIRVTGTSRDNIYDIVFTDPDSAIAKKVVDELLNIFLEGTLGDSRRDTSSTQKFLDEQIAEYEQKLVVAEERLKEFKQRNVGVMPGSQGGYFERAKVAGEQLAEAKLQLQEAVNRRNQLATQISDDSEEEALFGYGNSTASSPALQSIDLRVQNLQSQLDELLLRFTDRHPDVVNIRQTLESLAVQREKEAAIAAEQAAAGGSVGDNPYQSQIKLSLAESDAQVASLQTRVAEYDRRVAELTRLVDTVPEVEAELSRLNRDYEIMKGQYDALVSRREQARLGQEASQSTDDVQIKVLEPPRQPLIPTGPNRMMLLSFVFALSLGIGAGLSFLLSQVKPRIFTSGELKEFAGVPVVGTVSLLAGPIYRRQRTMEMVAFGSGLFVLVVLYGGLMSLHLANVNVHQFVAKVIGA